MDFYDLAYPKSLEGGIGKRLGFKKILVLGKDLKISAPNSPQNEISDSLCIGYSGEQLCSAAKLSPRAILIRDSRIDRKLIEILRSKEIILCIAFDGIMENAGLRRSSQLYMMSKLVSYALKKKIQIAFVTLAKSEETLCSPIQLIELAKLVGASDLFSRSAICNTNKELMIE